MLTRTQLSLFVPGPESALLELVRRRLDPVQAGLIPAHVTLCREDELTGLGPSQLVSRLAAAQPITLGFGSPVTFDGHGILLPCTAGEPDFAALREQVLARPGIRRHVPHLTLAHPRNPKSPGEPGEILANLPEEISITFEHVQWIEQVGGDVWRVVEEFALAGA